MKAHIGAYKGYAMTHQAIGKALGVSHTTVQRIERSALKKLRDNIIARQLLESLAQFRRSNLLGTLYRDEQGGENEDDN